MKRTLILALALELGLATAMAQDGGGSPYSAYGFGDMVLTGQATQGMMAGTGLALPEPFSVVPGNPAGYTALERPVFEVGTLFRNRKSSSSDANGVGKDAKFMGFSIGVPFAKGNWGMAMGMAPVSEVDYSLSRSVASDVGDVQYRYRGSGGLDRAFFGLGRVVYRQRTDSVGNRGHQVSVGADFNFLFGSLDQTRDAIYSYDDGYSNVRAISAMVLRAPTANASVLWQGDLTRKRHRDDSNWRWSVGLAATMPATFSAKYTELAYTYVAASGMTAIRDTISSSASRGKIHLPIGTGVAFGVQDQRWGITAEVRQRNWGSSVVEVPQYAMAAPMREALSYQAAVRFRPGAEGGPFMRTVYRLGIRYGQEHQEVQGEALGGSAVSAGLSIPLNAVQTNSWLHIGGEYGVRGTTENGLLRERHMSLWLGLAFTPWRGERWFVPSKIQ